MKHLYIYLDKTNGFVRKLWLMAAFLLCSLQINAQCRPGSVTFQSQQELEAFAAQYPNCTRIFGDVIIPIGSNVTSLSPLQNIITIDGDLNINGYFLYSLDGLSSLKNIGGSLIVSNNSSIISFTGLSSLTNIGENLDLQYNRRLIAFYGLSTLTSIGGSLLANDTHISDFVSLSSLTTIGGDLNVQRSVFYNFIGLSSLNSIGGNIDIRNTNAFQEFVGLSSLQSIGGTFMLDGSNFNNFVGLSSLTTIGGGLSLLGSSRIRNVNGLNSLISIGEGLWIEGNSELTNLNALSSLKTVGGRFYINGNSKLESVNFSALLTIGADIRIQANQNLKSLETLTSLTRATGDLYINSNANLTDISGLKNLDPTKITNLSINGNTKLAVCNNAFVCSYLQGSGVRGISNNATGCENPNTVIFSCTPACEVPADIVSSNIISNKAKISWTSTGSAFDLEWGEVGFTQGTGTVQNGVSATNYTITGLTESTSYDVYVRQNCTADQSDWVKYTFSTISVCPTGDVILSSQEEVDDFEAKYPNCTQTEGSLILLYDITDLSPLSKLQNIGTHLAIYETPLTNLNGLSSLTSINGGIEIGSNFELEDISGLKNINSGIINLSILANLKLSVCNIASICNYLQTSGYRVIEENATGCEDENAVQTACSATLSTSDINKKGVMVYPNPFTDVINLSGINNIQSVTVNDISGKLIKTIKPTREINFSDNASGVYIINVKFKDGDVKSFKVIKK